ncbi:HisA/HisF-related TIM barrel protein, partial [uncultured Kingella sp.]|uniref:HisA/HisF-related TIM barrel protein n=1 Tax=uncultured Kingella sp. TaxID=159270 RepID=UPI00338D77B6
MWEAIDALNRAGARLLVVTDVHRDGMMAGSNIELLQRVSGATDAGILASGGVD